MVLLTRWGWSTRFALESYYVDRPLVLTNVIDHLNLFIGEYNRSMADRGAKVPWLAGDIHKNEASMTRLQPIESFG